MSTTIDFIKACSVAGHAIALPAREHYEIGASDYAKFKKAIIGIGGRYASGKGIFEFDFDPTELLTRLCEGENYQKTLQFFATPERAAKRVEEQINRASRGSRWLEPSAGRGSLVQAIRNVHQGVAIHIDACEIDPVNRMILQRQGVNLVGEDFLELHTTPSQKYDGIVMNPPFSRDQYIKHITAAYDHLKPGGNLVFIAPTAWQEPRSAMEQEFNDLVTPTAYEIQTLPAGTFRESGTAVETVLVGMHRPRYDYNYTYAATMSGTESRKRTEPSWAASIEAEALHEIQEYFEFIDTRGPADITLFNVRAAAADLGFTARDDFCLPIFEALTAPPAPAQLTLPEDPKPVYDYGF